MLFSRLQCQTVCNLHSSSKIHKRHPLLASKHQQETTLPKRFPVGAKILGQNELKFARFHNDMCRGQNMNSPDSPGSQATPAFHQSPFATTIQHCTKTNSFRNIKQQRKHWNMGMISVISPLFVKVCQLFRNLFAPDLATIGCSWLLRSFFPFLKLPQREPSILSLLTMLNSYELQPIRFGGFYAACYPPDAWRSFKNAHEWINEAEFDGNDFFTNTSNNRTCKPVMEPRAKNWVKARKRSRFGFQASWSARCPLDTRAMRKGAGKNGNDLRICVRVWPVEKHWHAHGKAS